MPQSSDVAAQHVTRNSGSQRRFCLLFSLLFMGGCFGMRPASVPMPAVFHEAASPDPTGLIVFLPGMGNGPSQYERSGFVDIVRRVAPHFDMIAADAHFGYFRNWQVTDRLHADLIAPVAHRYDEIWIVGISIGGLVATTYAMEHEDIVDGAIALAPYLGDRKMIHEVRDAGGLMEWSAPNLEHVKTFERKHYYRLWTWFKEQANPTRSLPRLYIGIGEDDKLFAPNAMIIRHLAPDQTWVRPGGHDWKTWTPLFETLAQRTLLKGGHEAERGYAPESIGSIDSRPDLRLGGLGAARLILNSRKN